MTERGLIHKWKSDILEKRHIQMMFYKMKQTPDVEDFSQTKSKAL